MTLTLDAPRIVTTKPLLSVENVSKTYGHVQAVRNVSAIAYPGEVLGIVGESGSGKSTLLRMMNLEETPDTGSYTLDLPDTPGNLFELDRFARRMLCATKIGIVYQNPHLGLLMKHSSSGNVAERLLVSGERSFATLRKKATTALDASEFPLNRLDAPPLSFLVACNSGCNWRKPSLWSLLCYCWTNRQLALTCRFRRWSWTRSNAFSKIVRSQWWS